MVNLLSLRNLIYSLCHPDTQALFSQWHAFPILNSTQAYAHQHLIVPYSALVFTPHQHAGYGRRHTPWLCMPGNIALTCVIPTHWQEPPVTLGLALTATLAQAFTEQYPDAVFSLKWPNDLWFHEQKIAGCMVETLPTHTLIGVGFNYAHAPEGRAFLRQIPNNGYAHTVAVILNCIQKTLSAFQAQGPQAFSKLWRHYDALKGKNLLLTQQGRFQEGLCMGIDVAGGLQIQMADGMCTLHSPEGVHIGAITQ